MLYDLTTITQYFDVPIERKELYGEVVTDFKLIEEMFSLIPESFFSNPTLTWLDVGAGSGYFTIVLFNKLFYGLENIISNSEKRIKHILTKMITLVEINNHHTELLKSLFGKNAQIEIRDFLSYEPCKKYDIIYGNPPYTCLGSIKTPTNKNKNKKQDGKTVWPEFIKHSLHILKEGGFLLFIVPSLWMRPDKAHMHELLLKYKIHKCKCLTNTETNKWFKKKAQTPTCFFLLEKTIPYHFQNNSNNNNSNTISLYDSCYKTYKSYNYLLREPLPLLGCSIISKLREFVEKVGHIKIEKTNLPPKAAKLSLHQSNDFFYENIRTCILGGSQRLQAQLVIQYSNIPLKYNNQKKLVLAHKMYGFPYYDKEGKYGISNRDNYIILNKTNSEFLLLQQFLSSELVLYVFETTRYRMSYLEKEAFMFLPDICKLEQFPATITNETLFSYFGINEVERNHIENFSSKKYLSF